MIEDVISSIIKYNNNTIILNKQTKDVLVKLGVLERFEYNLKEYISKLKSGEVVSLLSADDTISYIQEKINQNKLDEVIQRSFEIDKSFEGAKYWMGIINEIKIEQIKIPMSQKIETFLKKENFYHLFVRTSKMGLLNLLNYSDLIKQLMKIEKSSKSDNFSEYVDNCLYYSDRYDVDFINIEKIKLNYK